MEGLNAGCDNENNDLNGIIEKKPVAKIGIINTGKSEMEDKRTRINNGNQSRIG